jgi:hypothetical protein
LIELIGETLSLPFPPLCQATEDSALPTFLRPNPASLGVESRLFRATSSPKKQTNNKGNNNTITRCKTVIEIGWLT